MREPDIHIDGWRLDYAEQLHAEHPNSFEIPPMLIREILQPGDFVKPIFFIGVTGKAEIAPERMWVLFENGLQVGILVFSTTSRLALRRMRSYGAEQNYLFNHDT